MLAALTTYRNTLSIPTISGGVQSSKRKIPESDKRAFVTWHESVHEPQTVYEMFSAKQG